MTDTTITTLQSKRLAKTQVTKVIKMSSRASSRAADVVSIMRRDGPFGNPFFLANVRSDREREECIDKFAQYFFAKVAKDHVFRDAVLALRGKTLGCCCKPKACHGDVIVWWLNEGNHTRALVAQDSTDTSFNPTASSGPEAKGDKEDAKSSTRSAASSNVVAS